MRNIQRLIGDGYQTIFMEQQENPLLDFDNLQVY